MPAGSFGLFDHLDYNGFAMANEETMELLNKAMAAGSGVDASQFTGGRALIPESLDQTLVNILWTQDEAVLFQRLKKTPVKGPVYQWDARTGVGATDGAWVSEGGNSQPADQVIGRQFTTMKYLQVLRTVTLQASLSNMIEDAIALEKNAGTLWLIQQIEQALFYADSSMNPFQPDGLIKQIPSTNVIDVHGADATSSTFEDAINNACRLVRTNYGRIDLQLSSPWVMLDVQKLLRDRIRFGGSDVVPGSAVFNKYPTPFGTFELKEDIFIQERGNPVASTLTTLRPDAPTFTLSAQTNVTGSAFKSTDAGTYYYTVVSSNEYGDSVAATAASQAVVALGSVTLAVTQGTITPRFYKVYRSRQGAASGADCRYMFSAAYTASPMNIVDLNTSMPGCSDVFLLTMGMNYDAISWAQFLPMMKFDLYPTNAAVYPFLMLLFGALALKKPVQHVRIANVQPSNLGWY